MFTMSDVAKRLGLSKAAVSFAVNNRPGVSESTRARVLECIRQMEEEEKEKGPAVSRKGLLILVYFRVTSKHIATQKYPLYFDVFQVFAEEADRRGYLLNTVTVQNEESLEHAVAECRRPEVKGIIFFATGMSEEQYAGFRSIDKPIVLYDQEAPDNTRSSVCIDNFTAVHLALESLQIRPTDVVKYLRSDEEIYNLQIRRRAFITEMLNRGRYVEKSDYVTIDFYPEKGGQDLMAYLQKNPLPDCFLAENYSVAEALLTTLNRLSISYPSQVRIASIDVLSEYIPGQNRIVQVSLPHAERTVLVLDILEQEIADPSRLKQRVLALPCILSA